MIITFRGNLSELLRRELKGRERLEYALNRRASVKDVIEACGVPHTEVGRLTADGREISFAYLVNDCERVGVYPSCPPVDVMLPTLLRPRALSGINFAVDANVGKLASLLRMAGFDTFYRNYVSDQELMDVAIREERILLSKDKGLLKRKGIVFGHLVREIVPARQLAEIVEFFGLKDRLRPFSRCLQCNGLLLEVEKLAIIDRLEPLTKKYYNSFCQCSQCGNIYWPGSHRENMVKILYGCCSYREG